MWRLAPPWPAGIAGWRRASRNMRPTRWISTWTTCSLKFTTFKERILSWTRPGQKVALGGENAAVKKFPRNDLEALKKSLVYFLNHRIVISHHYRVYGYQTTVFIEGVQSLSFKKFKLDQGGDTSQLQGTYIDKIWYYPSQGLVVNSHLLLEKAVRHGMAKTSNMLDIKYDILGQVESGSAFKLISIRSIRSA